MNSTPDPSAHSDWSAPRRTHPWSIVVNAVHEARRVVVGLVIAVFSGRALGGGQLVEIAVPVGVALLGVLGWLRTGFQITADEVRLASGVLFRQKRSARFDRIQAVDLDQPVVARVFGLAELRIQFGGGREGHFRLACLRLDEAGRLRAYLLSRVEQVKAAEAADAEAADIGADADTNAVESANRRAGTATWSGPAGSAPLELVPAGPDEPMSQNPAISPISAGPPTLPAYGGADNVAYGFEPGETPLASVPHGRYLAAAALSGPVWFAVLALAASAVALAIGASQVLASVLPETIGVIGFAWDRFQRYYGFTLAQAGDGLRLRHGLLNRYAQTVPISRLQAVEISQPLLWRAPGWARVRMNVAGYAHGGGRGEGGRRNTAQLLTVVPLATAFDIAGRLLGVELGTVALEPVPDRARWRAFAWRRAYAFGVNDTVVVARRGLLHRRFGVIPHAKVQSLHLIQGPWQRSLSLASVALHSTRGPVRILLKHRDIAEAQRFLEQQSQRSATARHLRSKVLR